MLRFLARALRIQLALVVASCAPASPSAKAPAASPSASASANSSKSASRANADDGTDLPSAVRTYCDAESQCRNQQNSPCDTAILQMTETGCGEPMRRYYVCRIADMRCVDGNLETPDCADESAAMYKCFNHEK